MTPEVAAEILLHNLSLGEEFYHDDFDHELCACTDLTRGGFTAGRRQLLPFIGAPDGGVCFACGGMTVRTGTCTTCTECGETGGCG